MMIQISSKDTLYMYNLYVSIIFIKYMYKIYSIIIETLKFKQKKSEVF